MCKRREEEKEYKSLKNLCGNLFIQMPFLDFKEGFPILFEKTMTPSESHIGKNYYYRDLRIIPLYAGSFLKFFHIDINSEE